MLLNKLNRMESMFVMERQKMIDSNERERRRAKTQHIEDQLRLEKQLKEGYEDWHRGNNDTVRKQEEDLGRRVQIGKHKENNQSVGNHNNINMNKIVDNDNNNNNKKKQPQAT